jgi:protocatechuate 3,4-dioxygenase beta subunit
MRLSSALNMTNIPDDLMPKGTILIIGILILTFAPLGMSSYIVNESAFAQDTYTTLSALPASPAPFEQLSLQQIATSTNETCTLTPSLIEIKGTPQQTEGPYFVDGMPNHSDIRFDTSDGSVQEGILLQLILNVYDLDDNDGSCTPLRGAHVDVWHANPQGVYSDISEAGTEGKNFLRGNQVTDDNGTVQFTTIYPGWYEGRAIHIHDKVRTFGESENPFEWTSQLYFNNSINEQVHQQPPYSDHGSVELKNEEDMIFRGPSTDGLVDANSGEHLMLNLTKETQGYTGTFNILVDANQSE